jgi:hypothetical protein
VSADYNYRDPLKCDICDGLTNGYTFKGHILCAYCLPKYSCIPDHIPIGLWGKYVKIKKAKQKAKLVPFLREKQKNMVSLRSAQWHSQQPKK